MRAVLQRVLRSSVKVDNETVGKIDNGFLILLGVCDGDAEREAEVLAKKTAGLRVFDDENGKMNLSITDVGGAALVVSQFTLYADCSHGRRPSFINAARPEIADPLYEHYCKLLAEYGVKDVQKGVFGADMKVDILNDGPVTIILDTKELCK